MRFDNETAPAGTHPFLATMINQPVFAIIPFLAFIVGGTVWNIGLLFTVAFLYLGMWCVYRNRTCGTPHCGFTGPLFLFIALFSLLRWVPPFAGSDSAWSDWDHLIPVAWIGSIAAFTGQWLETRRRSDLAWTAGLFVGSLLDYVF